MERRAVESIQRARSVWTNLLKSDYWTACAITSWEICVHFIRWKYEDPNLSL